MLFWFPWRWPVATLAAFMVVPLVCFLALRRGVSLVPSRSFTRPLLLLLLSTCLATIPIVDWRLGLPKVLGMVLGVFVFLVLGHILGSRRALAQGVLPWSVFTILFAVAGVMVMTPGGGKLPVLDVASERVTAVVALTPWRLPRNVVNPNELAGVLVLLFPVLLGQSVGAARAARSRDLARFPSLLQAVFAGAAGIVILAALALSQSRSGLAGGAASAVVLGAVLLVRLLRSHRAPLGVRAAVLLCYCLLLVMASWGISQLLIEWTGAMALRTERSFLETRFELWNRALYILQDFPITGIGLGQFPVATQSLYPVFTIPPSEPPAHPHNVFLAYSAELGIPGLAAMVWLFTAVFRGCAQALRDPDPLLSWTAIGVALGLFGFLTYGLADAIGPGARGGLFLWITLGFGAAVGLATRSDRSPTAT